MSGSSFGKAFNITTFGESHGQAIGVVIQGCPPGLAIDEALIQKALDKRKPGQGISGTKRKEPDHPIIMSGTFNGLTTGTPIMIMIENKDAKSKSYDNIASLFRPGHGDYTYQAKYGIRDFRGGGRASARETAARVAAGAVAQLVLDQQGIKIKTYTLEIGGIRANRIDDISQKAKNDLLCPDSEAVRKMELKIADVKKQGDSLGGVVQIIASNVPAGIGEPVFDKLDADIAKALMSIGAVKAVEIGAGTCASQMTGFENNDQILPDGFQTNHSGGILAGISNGDDIIARVHVKPIPSILKPQKTIDENGNSREISTQGRHDICAIPRINMVCEAMMAIVLTDHILRQKTLG
ncbi:chorismate synthase [Desulfobacula toluolica]|uniref:Chorismate synthase n=1 Tax=Desulfobacula toluolica (strain DSM 7467 / Tol2) TaxID=651182 RepID=K0NN64_DESTT|nr:chorismate synthase [Desulfobacula toluolica]CCK80152.1 AroC: chorismate synthase (5-enolpyruvylshikimate-3-phosphate phospholyase) [Desulfobacula toluolica Tol2]